MRDEESRSSPMLAPATASRGDHDRTDPTAAFLKLAGPMSTPSPSTKRPREGASPLDNECRRETFFASDEHVARVLQDRAGNRHTRLLRRRVDDSDPTRAYDHAWLRLDERQTVPEQSAPLRIADLFSGIGGLSVAAAEAASSLGMRTSFAFASDVNSRFLDCYAANFQPAATMSEPIETAVDGDLGEALSRAERELREMVGQVDLLLAGPPCQGHSDLNNHTRRDDHRNSLYLRAARFAEVFTPPFLVIENVRGAIHDRRQVVQRTVSHLLKLGYFVDSGVIKAEEVGVPQVRRRFFIVASLTAQPSIEAAAARAARRPRPVLWAIDDLSDEGQTPFDSASRHSAENRRRIEYLFRHGLYELPDQERPSCHRDQPHSYKSVYGRMHPDRPAPTITGGFGSTGQGRFVHPSRERTLTPHEAARVQTIPDWFDFSGLRRRELQTAIGNAVPPLMTMPLLAELLA